MPIQTDVEYESGATSHLDRMNLTKRLCDHLEPLFSEIGIDYKEYGQNVILAGNGSMIARLRKLDAKKSEVICMTKFSPDYILRSEKNGVLFMMDAKVSITPMFFDSAIKTLQYKSRNETLSRHTIGEVEREAWDNYVNCFPKAKVAICLAAPYHPRLVVAEWATNLKALYRFAADTNVDAGGSKTPHVNIDLNAMRTLKQFLEDECQADVSPELYQIILDDIKKWGLNKSTGRVNWVQFNNVIINLHPKCPWLKGKLPGGHPYRTRIIGRLEAAGVEYELF